MQHLAKEGRDAGMAAAIEHADRVHEDWSNRAFIILQSFAQTSTRPFMCEEVREHAEQSGLEDPPSKRAWGVLMMKAARKGLIKKCGYGKTGNPKAHMTPATIWEKVA